MPPRRRALLRPALDTTMLVYQPSETPSLLVARESSSTGLTDGQIGGLVGGIVGMLLVCIVATVWVIRHLHKLAAARKNGTSSHHGHRRSAGGSAGHVSSGRRTSRQTKMEPTPSQVERLDYDDLLERETIATVAEATAAVPNSGASDAGGPPSIANLSLVASPGGSVKSGSIRRLSGPPAEGELEGIDVQTTMLASFQEQERRKAWQRFHEVPPSSAESRYGTSEAGSSVRGGPRKPAELDVDGGFIPELPTDGPDEAGTAPTERHSALEQQWRWWHHHHKLGAVSENPDLHDAAANVEMTSGMEWQSMGRKQTEQTSRNLDP